MSCCGDERNATDAHRGAWRRRLPLSVLLGLLVAVVAPGAAMAEPPRRVTAEVSKGCFHVPVYLGDQYVGHVSVFGSGSTLLLDPEIAQACAQAGLLVNRGTRQLPEEAERSPVQVYVAPSVSVAGYRKRDVAIGCSSGDLALSVYFGTNRRGQAPLGYFRPQVLQFDYDAALLWVAAASDELDLNDAALLELAPGSNGLVVMAKVNGLPARKFLLEPAEADTVTIFSKAYAQEVVDAIPAQKRTTLPRGKILKGSIVRLESLEVGRFVIPAPLCALDADGVAKRRLDDDVVGTLGGRFLSRFVVTVDTGQSKVWLAPGKRLAQREEYDMSGLRVLGVRGHSYVIDEVAAHSSAEAAGLAPNDFLVRIDGKPFDRWTLDEVEERLRSGEGEKVSLRVRRQGQERDVTLVLKRRI